MCVKKEQFYKTGWTSVNTNYKPFIGFDMWRTNISTFQGKGRLDHQNFLIYAIY